MSESPASSPERGGAAASIYLPTVRLSAGRGLIGRRDRAIVFLPSGHHVLLDRLLEAEHAQLASVIADIVLSDVDGAPDFVLITWPHGPDTGDMHVIARGAVQLTSTLPSLPTLSGTGSTTWVEHRVPRNPAQATLSLGADVQPGTDLVAGIAPAGGFELHLTAQEMTIAAPTPSTPSPRRQQMSPPANVAAEPTSALPSEPPALHDEATLTADLLEFPRAAVGPAGDTNTLDTSPAADRVAADHGDKSANAGASAAIDPTGALDRLSALRAATGQEQPESEPTAATTPAAAPPEPPDLVPAAAIQPPMPAVADQHVSRSTPPEPPSSRAGYRLVLPSGAHFDLDRTVVIGRQPAIADAGMTDDDEVSLLPLSVPPSVSRTHAFVRVDSDGAAIVDCGSGGGTAIAGLVGELVSVAPWVPTPLAAGDTIYLGGPTALVVEEMTS